MGSKNLEVLLERMILETGHDNITFIGANLGYKNKRDKFIEALESMGVEVDNIDMDPAHGNPRDAVFDEIDFNDLVVVFNAEKHYPIGRLTSREMIIVGDNDGHSGNSLGMESCEHIIELNNIKEVHSKTELEKWYIVHGNS